MRGTRTLLDLLVEAADKAPDQVIVPVDRDGGERPVTYRDLHDRAYADAARWADQHPAGTPVTIPAKAAADFLADFWGALAAGLVPVPLAPTAERLTAVRAQLGDPPVPLDPDLAYLQFSSGSTGAPRGVRLTHAAVLANLDQGRATGLVQPGDVIVSWLPFFHDMGLIGAHLMGLAVRAKQVFLDPLDFARRPAAWYAAATRHRATVLPMASFALGLTCRRVSADQVATFDLSAVRIVGVGAEPISVDGWRRFRTHLAPAGLRPDTVVPLYGLAEAALAVAVPPLDQPVRVHRLDRTALAEGRVREAEAAAAEFLEVGPAVPGGELRIVAEDGRVRGDEGVGMVEFRGPNVAAGYHAQPADTEQTFAAGWLRTGDLGFLRDGRLTVTGRAKDVIFLNGRKHHAHDVEQVVGRTLGPAGTGPVAAVGSTDPATGTERVLVFVPRRDTSPDQRVRVQAAVREALAHDDVRVLPIPLGQFPRTTSGKLQRGRLRAAYEAGAFDAPPSRAEVEAEVTRIWAEVLEVPAATIRPDDRFLAIGGTSLRAMHVLARLEEAYARPLDPAVLRDAPTVAALTDQLLDGPAGTPAPPPVRSSPGAATDDPAVIGLACRFPDADTPEAFWANLTAGRDSVTEVPADRWVPAPGAARWGAFLTDVAGFDAGFFGLGDDEADVTDPHARLFLEVAHEALERAGYAGPRRAGRRVGVFVAVGESGYPELLHRALDAGIRLPPTALVGNLRNLIAARVAHRLDLTGPALAVDTACSSALVALHLARRSLAAGECDLAVVGGVSLNLTATGYRLLDAAQALSPTGRSRAFGAGADGFVPGEGAAALVLTPLSAALDRGDPVAAVVRGTAVNNDGRALSLMAPNPHRQQEVIAAAYAEAGLDPASVGYVEAHGTGTAIGDPIEVRSLAAVFPPGAGPRGLGSVKTNVGHLLNAAGLPSLVKVVLSLQHRQLPPSLHGDPPSADFDLGAAGLAVVGKAQPWVSAAGPRRAGVNGFGFGGTNAHAILEEHVPPAVAPLETTSGPYLVTLSAATESALRQVVADLGRHARAHPDLDLGALVASASAARDDRPYRMALVVGEDLADRLEAVVAQPGPVGRRAGRRPRLVLVVEGADAPVAEVRARLADWGVRPEAGGAASGEGAAERLTLRAGPAPDAYALLGLVGRLWERGLPVRRPDLDRPRVPVPTYPFQRTRHWLPTVAAPTIPAVSPLLHRFALDEVPLPAGRRLRSVRVVGDHPGLVPALTERLVRRDVEVLAAGPPSSKTAEELPVSHAESRNLSAVFERDEGEPVVLALAGPAVDLTEVGLLDAAVRAGIELISGLARGDGPGPVVVVTEDASGAGSAVRPAQAVVAGLARTWAEETGRALRVVDLGSEDDERDRVEALVRELDAPPAPGVAEVVAWRAGRRLTRTPVLGEPTTARRPNPLPPDGRYLITGGAGGIGSALASFLAGRGRPELILVGRGEAPAGLGADVRYGRVDLTDPDAVDRLVRQLPRLDAVFHAAGVLTPGALSVAGPETLATTLGAKVRGTWLLTRALDRHDRRPPVFVALSSIAAALPGHAGGLGAYAAANAFLDAYAYAETLAGRPFQALDLAAVRGVGLAGSPEFRRLTERRPVPQLDPAAAIAALVDATAVAEPRLLVLDADPTSDLSASVVAIATTHADQSEGVLAVLRRLLAAELQVAPTEIDPEASFLALGLDSLAAVDLVPRLEAELGRSLPSTLLFEYPSLATLSAHLFEAPPSDLSASVVAIATTHADKSEMPVGFPLAPVQQAFHTAGRLHPEVAAYACLRQDLAGPLDEHRLGRALAALARRHPMLRLRVSVTDGTTQQSIAPVETAEQPRWFAVVDADRPLAQIEDELVNRVFRLADEAPLRAVLVRHDEGAALLLCAHHLAVDGASLHRLAEELWTAYAADESTGPEPAATFAQHVEAVSEVRRSTAYAEDLAWWTAELSARPEPVPLPVDHPPDADSALTARQFALDPDLTRALRERAAALDVSLFHLVLTGYARRLAAWGNGGRAGVNVARAGRDPRVPGIGEVVGSFADTLPLTVAISGDDAVDARGVRDGWLRVEQHGTVSSLDLARLGPQPAALAGFSFARFPRRDQADGPVRVVGTAARTASAATRLSLVVWEFDGALHCSWNYPQASFDDPTIERLTADLRAELTRLAEPEPAPSIAARIQAQARRTPTAVAVEEGEDTLDYAELDRRAGAVAETLRTRGVRPGDRVALVSAGGIAAVIDLLGILYAGAAWVPLDPSHPEARRADQAARAGVVTVLDGSSSSEDCRRVAAFPGEKQQSVGGFRETGTDTAYVIFTSGTTGRPKGVPITHAALTRYLDWAITTFGYAAGDRLAATASLCFDASVRQLLAPLLVGATVVVIGPALRRDPDALLRAVSERRVSVWSSVPTLWAQLIRAAERAAGRREPVDLTGLRLVHVGGEALPPGLVRRWFDLVGPSAPVVNLYGPTETTINATYEVIEARPAEAVTRLPIGRPVAQTVTEVVDGELWLSGPGLSRGYLDDDAATAAAFVDRDGQRWYRTGDRVERGADGRLGYLGRNDRQVKLHGYRIEPAEIEVVLQQHPGVERAVVVAEGEPPTRLVAHVEVGAGIELNEAALRAHLADRLPDHLVPARFRLLDRLPLTPAGKLDPERLADPGVRVEPAPAPNPRGDPATDTERLLARIWADLLDRPAVGRDDDFFALGGDSIAALEVFTRLEAERPQLPPPTALYRHRRLADLAAVIDALAPDDDSPRNGAEEEGEGAERGNGEFALTPSQRGFLLAEALAPEARSSWLAVFGVTGLMDPDRLAAAVDALVDRHLMLRVAVAASRRPPVQAEVPPPARIAVPLEAIGHDELPARIAAERAHRFAAGGWPLLRLRLLRLGPAEHVLLVHAHHLVGDGYSVVVLAQDLLALYDGVALPPLRSTVRDYVAALPAPEANPAGPGAPAYAPPRLRRDATRTMTSVTARLTRRLTARVKAAATAAGVTPYAPLLTAYHRALARRTGQPDLLIGVAVAGRDLALPDLGRLVGPLASILPVRLAPHGPFGDQLREVSAAVAAAREGGPSLQQRLAAASAEPLGGLGAQLLFSYLDFDALGPLTGRTLRLTWAEEGTDLEPPPVGTDLLLTGRPVDGELRLVLRSPAGALDSRELGALLHEIEEDLAAFATPVSQPVRRRAPDDRPLDAGLVGYLPGPAAIAALLGLPATPGLREQVRTMLFADGRPRLLERIDTPLGRSGFVALPLLADELAGQEPAALARRVAAAVEVAAQHGARCVSLAGLLPAYTGYGLAVAARPSAAVQLTTGHATTAASVVLSVQAAVAAAGRDLRDCRVAVVGLGSIGRTTLELVLATEPRGPDAWLLCDRPDRAAQLDRLAEELRARGQRVEIAAGPADGSLPAAAYAADVLIVAISADRAIVEVDRLRPGTVVVDDSFPPAVDHAAARARMASAADVLVVGGGLLQCGPIDRVTSADEAVDAHADRLAAARLPGAIASCQLESLLLAANPALPPVHGLVEPAAALAYWRAMTERGIGAAPLHLGAHPVVARP